MCQYPNVVYHLHITQPRERMVLTWKVLHPLTVAREADFVTVVKMNGASSSKHPTEGGNFYHGQERGLKSKMT